MKKIGSILLKGLVTILPIGLTVYFVYWLGVTTESLLSKPIKWAIGDEHYWPGMGLITGSLVVEKIFGLPGLGKFFVISALQRDYTVVMGMVIFYAGLILVLNLLADLLYAALDPRVVLK